MKAVVIFNLGGPDNLKNVRPFLFNLFYDKAILNLINPFRYLLAKLVSTRRNSTAQDIYKHLGGRSPILEETQKQADALQKSLGEDYKVFVCMRYWFPLIDSVIKQVMDSNPEEIILLPLYPQYSLATTGSFFDAWDKAMKETGCLIPLRKICCYPSNSLFNKSYMAIISQEIKNQNIPQNARYLFSAHGLPKKNIAQGDPYEEHVHFSVNEVTKGLPLIRDYVICYQSKVGPLEWLGPSTEDEILRAANDKVPIVIVPISFVSENSETLYELDYLYHTYANSLGLTQYYRIPTVQANTLFIEALASLVQNEHQQPCLAIRCQLSCNSLRAA